MLDVAGVRIDGAALEAGRGRRKIRLPAYPFQRARYWLDSLDSSASTRVSAVASGAPRVSRSPALRGVTVEVMDAGASVSGAVELALALTAAREAHGGPVRIAGVEVAREPRRGPAILQAVASEGEVRVFACAPDAVDRADAWQAVASARVEPREPIGVTQSRGERTDNDELQALTAALEAEFGAGRRCVGAEAIELVRDEHAIVAIEGGNFVACEAVISAGAAESRNVSRLAQRVAAAGEAEGRRMVEQLVRDGVRRILGLPESVAISAADRFFELGIDSFTSIELREQLAKAVDPVPLPTTLVLDYPSVAQLGDFLYAALRPAAAPEPEAAAFASAADTLDIDALSDEEATLLLLQELNSLSGHA